MDGAKFFFLFFLLLPFQFSLGSFGSSDLPLLRIIIPCIFLVWFAQGLLTRKITLPKPITAFFLVTFLFWSFLSVFWAENGIWALKKWIFWLNFFPLLLVLISVFKNEKTREKALQGLIWGAGIVAVVGIVQFLLQFIISLSWALTASLKALIFTLGPNFAASVIEYPSVLVNIGGHTLLRAFAFFPDPHVFAFYTGMILPLSLYRSLKKDVRVWERYIPYLLLLATLLSFSRSSYVALLVMALVTAVMLLWRKGKELSVFWILSMITLVVVLFISPMGQRLQSSFSYEDASVTERSRLLTEALENIGRDPLLGVGLGNYPLTVKPSAEVREPIYVHNLYLDIAVELGIVGLALFLSLLLSCLPKFSFLKEKYFTLREALALSLLYFLAQSFFEYPLSSIHILTLLLTILAFLYVEKK